MFIKTTGEKWEPKLIQDLNSFCKEKRSIPDSYRKADFKDPSNDKGQKYTIKNADQQKLLQTNLLLLILQVYRVFSLIAKQIGVVLHHHLLLSQKAFQQKWSSFHSR